MEKLLAKEWVSKPLGKISRMVYGKGLLTKELLSEGYTVYGANGIIGKYSKYTFEDSKVTISCRGAASGAIHKTEPKSFITSNSIVIDADPKDINIDFLKYALSSVDKTKIVTGSAQPQITIDNLKDLEIPIAPISEQQKIVAKLDALMERVNANKQRLDKIPQILKRFRQSVLAAAINGKLTKEWREKNLSKNEKVYPIKRAEDICELITKGTTPTNGGMTEMGEIPYLKVYNIVDQKINFNYKPQFVSKEIHNNLLKRSRVYPGDVLMNIVGPPLGKVARVTNEYPEWNINQAIAFFRPKSEIITDFLYILLSEGTPIIEIEKEFRGTAGQSNISLEQCRNFNFPLPSIKEQKEIVKLVNELFAFADKVEARYTKAKQQLDKLPQSILAKAFRGELV